eukprot:TRINITY_DN44940_c0_g1_i1.p1 TRINITY_DN44940_c0_g1~~TRINITY_DN44940_c0_g1_i1.p1  ORF type:complete len:443 (-),score=54.23 TRINITY_DN44940_c0_g1_i1:61-1389(-)
MADYGSELMPSKQTIIMQGATPPSSRTVVLDTGSGMFARTTFVHFALLYPGPVRASLRNLADAFAKILPSFETLAGRMINQSDGKMAVLCNNAGVPLTHVVSKEPAPSFASTLAADHFDLVSPSLPQGEEPAQEALMKVQVTDFEDAQVLAVSLNHCLCDAHGIGRFMTAWAAAYRGEAKDMIVSHDRISCAVPTPGFAQAPLKNSEGIPKVWHEMRHSPESIPELEFGPLERPVIASLAKSAEECTELKARCNTESGGGVSVSTNDAVSAELAASLGVKGDHVPISMVMEYRALIGAETVFSNLWTMLELLVRNSLAGAGDIRRLVPQAQRREFLEWHIGQAFGGMNLAWKAKLMMNSWVKAFKLSDLKFAGPAEDVTLGFPMLKDRATGMVPHGCAYCIVLPQKDGGCKPQLVLPEAAARKLIADGNRVTMQPLSGTDAL